MSNFSYYEFQLKSIRPILGTCPSGDIMHEHVIEKARKQIKAANMLERKLGKKINKYIGAEDISGIKEIEELKGIIRTYCQILGTQVDIPDTLAGLLELSKELNEQMEEMIKSGDKQKATVFMRDSDGHPIISSHMILGNCKEILRTIVNGGDKNIFKSKVQLAESASLDIKPVEKFLRSSEPVEPDLLVRPIRFDQMGKSVTALVASEVLPEGTEFKCTLRVRKGSPLDSLDSLNFIFDHGKSLGVGAWRGSGNYGAYVYKLEELPEYKEVIEDGWK
jgi:hypothetical protein